jgi:hypothetical protein
MYYDKLKPEIDEAYNTYTASLKPNEKPKKRVNFKLNFCRKNMRTRKRMSKKRLRNIERNGGKSRMQDINLWMPMRF